MVTKVDLGSLKRGDKGDMLADLEESGWAYDEAQSRENQVVEFTYEGEAPEKHLKALKKTLDIYGAKLVDVR